MLWFRDDGFIVWLLCFNNYITEVNMLHQVSAQLQIRRYPENIFLIPSQNLCYMYLLEVPQWGTSNEYLNNMITWRNKKNTLQLKNVPYLELCFCITSCYQVLLWSISLLTLVLLNPDIPCFASSVDPDQLASDLDLHCLPSSMQIYCNNEDQVTWLAEN